MTGLPPPVPPTRITPQDHINAARAALTLHSHLIKGEQRDLAAQLVALLIDLRRLTLVTGDDYPRAVRSASVQFLREMAAGRGDPP